MFGGGRGREGLYYNLNKGAWKDPPTINVLRAFTKTFIKESRKTSTINVLRGSSY
jgi:hypothetical protein